MKILEFSLQKTAIAVILLSLLGTTSAQGQIVPDRSVNSRVTNQGNIFLIEDGSVRGRNLFHSFQKFSVPTGGTAYFKNAANIQNIFSRVTGKSISSIDGILKANSTANLFLLNPNGIVFGTNAQLDIGGSFLGTTANSIEFVDGMQFSALSPQSPPLLTVATPVGIQLGSNPGNIRVTNSGHQLSANLFFPVSGKDNPRGLQVLPGKTLALVGGDVFLDGGIIRAPGGRIEIGSVKQSQVKFDTSNTQRSFIYNRGSTEEITLTNRSLLETTGQGGALIGVHGRNIQFLKGSAALMNNQGVVADKELKVVATELIDIGDASLPEILASGLYSESTNSGPGAPITLISPAIVVRDGSRLSSRTFSSTDGGKISIKASKYLDLEGTSPINPLGVSVINTITFGSGKAGDINISTSQLSISQGGRLSSATFGRGDGGKVSVFADLVEVTGFEPIFMQPSNLSSASLGSGSSGNLVINTSKLILEDSGEVNVSISSSGNSGKLEINAHEYIEIRGSSGMGLPSSIAANAIQVDPVLRQLLKLPPLPSGDSGSVTINTPRLLLKYGGQLSARNEGTGDAGELKISANIIALEDNSLISAATFGGEGGNVFIFADFILLKDSSITASATQKGTGGNITAISDLVVAIGESSFTAEAEKGQGGNISITAQAAIFGPKVEFSVSSDAGLQLDGNINLDVEETGAEETTAPKPDVERPPQLISDCNPSTGDSKFVAMGPGALQVEPSHFAETDSILGIPTFQLAFKSQTAPPPIENPIVEATGWTKDNGKTVLITKTKTQSTHTSSDPSMCKKS